MRKLIIILMLFCSLVTFGQNPVFHFDARTGQKKDYIRNYVLTDNGGGLPVSNSIYGNALITNGTGYLGTDSIYDFGVLPWTFDFAIYNRGYSNGSIIGQHGTTTGYDFALRDPLKQFDFYVRNPNTSIITPTVNYVSLTPYHFVLTRGADDTVRSYIDGVLYDKNYIPTLDMTTTIEMYIGARAFNNFQIDSADIYYVKVYDYAKDDAYASQSYEYFIDGYQTTIHTPSNYDPYGEPHDLVFYFHGNGGTYLQDPPATWLDSLLSRGYVVAQTSGTNHWGNSTGQSIYADSLYNYVQNNFNVITTPQILSISMGTLASFNLLRSGNPMRARSNVLISAAINLDSMYYRDDDLFTGGIRTAYNFSTDGEYNDSTLGFNPVDDIIIGADTTYNKSIIPVYWLHGDADTIAPISEALLMHNALENQNSTFRTVLGATHSSGSVSTPTTISEALEWMEAYRGETPPITSTYMLKNQYQVIISNGKQIIIQR